MSVFSAESFSGHEQVVFASDPRTGLKAIIAIHDTVLGPALGGCRMYPYASEADALRDALRLSRGMTYKAAAAGLDLGGGKAVIIGDPRRAKSPALLQALGRAVERLGGRYITAEDVGTSVADFAEVRKETRHVVGLPIEIGGSGDPSPTTALGVYYGLKAAAAYRWNSEGLLGRTIAVQGLGNVGWHLCRLVADDGAKLVVADIDAARVEKAVAAFGAAGTSPSTIHAVRADILAPCAMGASLNAHTIQHLDCEIIGGAANNQLATDDLGEELRRRNVLYAPDFVINAGGMIRVASERHGFDQQLVDRKVREIGATLRTIFETADRENTSTHVAALHLAHARLRAAGGAFPAGLAA